MKKKDKSEQDKKRKQLLAYEYSQLQEKQRKECNIKMKEICEETTHTFGAHKHEHISVQQKNSTTVESKGPTGFKFALVEPPFDMSAPFSCGFKFQSGNFQLAGIGLSSMQTRKECNFSVNDNGNSFGYSHPDILVNDEQKQIVQLKSKQNNVHKIALAQNPLQKAQNDIEIIFTIVQANTKSDLQIGLFNKELAIKNHFTFKPQNQNHGQYTVSINGIQFNANNAKLNNSKAYLNEEEMKRVQQQKRRQSQTESLENNEENEEDIENESGNKEQLQRSFFNSSGYQVQHGENEDEIEEKQEEPQDQQQNHQNQSKRIFKFYHKSKISCKISFKNQIITYTNQADGVIFTQPFQCGENEDLYIGCVLSNHQDIIKINEKPQFGKNTYMITTTGFSISCPQEQQIENSQLPFKIKKGDIVLCYYHPELQELMFKKDSTFETYVMKNVTANENLHMMCMLYKKNDAIQFIKDISKVEYFREESDQNLTQEMRKLISKSKDEQLTLNSNDDRIDEFTQFQQSKWKQEKAQQQMQDKIHKSLSQSMLNSSSIRNPLYYSQASYSPQYNKVYSSSNSVRNSPSNSIGKMSYDYKNIENDEIKNQNDKINETINKSRLKSSSYRIDTQRSQNSSLKKNRQQQYSQFARQKQIEEWKQMYHLQKEEKSVSTPKPKAKLSPILAQVQI